MAGKGNSQRTVPDLERADPITVNQQAGRLRRDFLIAAAQLVAWLAGIEAHIAGQEARVARRDQHLGLGQQLV
jgi:hypothetical protein